jgi:hemerythrin superfamily protein
MNALELLKSQHDEVDELFEQLETTDSERRKGELFVELADMLAAHAKAEETLFYPAVMSKQTEEILLESAEEHLSVKRVLTDLLDLEVDDERFDAKLSVMKEQLEHHAREEEEGELFPKVRKLLSADELDALGGELLALFVDLLDSEPRTQVPLETAAAAPPK